MPITAFYAPSGITTPVDILDTTPATLPLQQTWSNTGLITTDDNWNGVPSIIGYRGDDLTTGMGADPQTLVADGAGTPVDVIANQSNPNTLATGGVAEFDGIADPVIALQGSGTSDAPHVVITLNTSGFFNIQVNYDLRDLDGSTDNAVQPVALQYRVGTSGNFTNLAAGFVADATTGPSQANLVTPVSVTLPSTANGQPQVQLRVLIANAVGNDEWVGIDNISITGTPFVPTMAQVSLSGRITDASGRPLRNVEVTIQGSGIDGPQIVYTGPLGYYVFNAIPAGSYLVSVRAPRHQFSIPERPITMNDNVIGFDFVADPQK